MAVWSERQSGYKGGVVLFCIGLVVFIVGFASPYWITSEANGEEGHRGLWTICGEDTCISITTDPDLLPSWFTAVRALQCLALIGFLLADFYTFYINWTAKSRIFNRNLEFAIGFSAVLGLIGTIIHVAKETEFKEKFDDGDFSIYELLGLHITDIDLQPVAWSCIVDIIGCILNIIAAIIIAVYNKPLPADIPSTYANVNPAAAPYVVQCTASPHAQGQPVDHGKNPPPSQPQMTSPSTVVTAGATGPCKS